MAQLFDPIESGSRRASDEAERGRARDDEQRPGERPAEAAGRQDERNREHGRDVGERHPRDRDEERVVAVALPMIGSTIAAELDATSTARIAGRCSPVSAASDGASAIESRDRDRRSPRARGALRPGSRVSRSGRFVATMNINSAKPMSARNDERRLGRDDRARAGVPEDHARRDLADHDRRRDRRREQREQRAEQPDRDDQRQRSVAHRAQNTPASSPAANVMPSS